MRNLAIVLGLALAGCGSDGGSSSTPPTVLPGLPPIVVTTPDSISLLPSGPIQDGTYEYDGFWPARQANLMISGITGGSIRIEIEDDNGVLVHDNTYTGDLTGVIEAITAPDRAPGFWEFRFTFANVASFGAIDIFADTLDQPDDIVIAGAYSLQSSYEFEAGWGAGPAKVTLASTVSQGTVRIRIWDGHDDLVMDCTNLAVLVGGTNGESNHGVAGNWRIRIDFDAVVTAGSISIGHLLATD